MLCFRAPAHPAHLVNTSVPALSLISEGVLEALQQVWLPQASRGEVGGQSLKLGMTWVHFSPGEGNGNSFQYSCLEHPMNRRGWWATVYAVVRGRLDLGTEYILTKGRKSRQFSSVKIDSVTPWIAACQASLSTTNSQSLLKLMSIESVMPSTHLIRCCPLLLLPSIFPSMRVFSNESLLCIRWPKYWSFSFSISPPNEYSGLISFRIDWFDLLAIQGTLKSLLRYHSSKASILCHSAFFKAQLSHPYMTTGKIIALTRRTFVSRIMSLLFNILFRFVIALLSRSKYLLISWLQIPYAVILEPKKIKSVTVSIVFLAICH